jgi:hypothetical protein
MPQQLRHHDLPFGGRNEVTCRGARERDPERPSMFSDGVFAVLITVLVLEQRPPELPPLAIRAGLTESTENRYYPPATPGFMRGTPV